MELRVWRLHPNGARIGTANAALDGQAAQSARKYCGPYLTANAAGYWVYSPVDLDVAWKPGNEIPWDVAFHEPSYTHADECVLERAASRNPRWATIRHRPRTKIFLSGLHDEPKNTVQIWLGCAFQTPPGWGIWLRGPANRNENPPFRIMEAVIEADWFHYDITLNLEFTRAGEVAHLRREGPPLAQLVPLPREATEHWDLTERPFDEDSAEARSIVDWWMNFDWEKHHAKGAKDPGTYHRVRRKGFTACAQQARI